MSERSPYRDGTQRQSVKHYDDHHSNDHHSEYGGDQDYRNADHQGYNNVQSDRTYHKDTSVTQLRPATVPTSSTSRIPDRIEEVWLKESRGRITFNDSDLMDVSRPAGHNVKKTISAVFGIAAMLGLIGFLALSSAPDLTPEEIIAMRGYAGEQSSKTPFNLASLRDCDDVSECSEKMDTGTGGTSNSGGSNSDSHSAVTVTASQTTPETTAETTAETTSINSGLSGYNELQEIPAATVPVIVDSAVRDNTVTGDQLTVLKQWSNVRSTPDAQSEILTSLAEGTNVTLLSQTGSWFEVSVYKRRQFIGYMHKSTLSEP